MECQTSWYPNTRGEGSRDRRCRTIAPTVYRRPPDITRIRPTGESPFSTSRAVRIATHPSPMYRTAVRTLKPSTRANLSTIPQMAPTHIEARTMYDHGAGRTSRLKGVYV